MQGHYFGSVSTALARGVVDISNVGESWGSMVLPPQTLDIVIAVPSWTRRSGVCMGVGADSVKLSPVEPGWDARSRDSVYNPGQIPCRGRTLLSRLLVVS